MASLECPELTLSARLWRMTLIALGGRQSHRPRDESLRVGRIEDEGGHCVLVGLLSPVAQDGLWQEPIGQVLKDAIRAAFDPVEFRQQSRHGDDWQCQGRCLFEESVDAEEAGSSVARLGNGGRPGPWMLHTPRERCEDRMRR